MENIKHSALVRGTKAIAKRLGMGQRTLQQRLSGEWAEGFGFFKDHEVWCIRESNIEQIIAGMEEGWINRKGAHVQQEKS